MPGAMAFQKIHNFRKKQAPFGYKGVLPFFVRLILFTYQLLVDKTHKGEDRLESKI